MLPAKRTQNWLPGIFNDFFGNEWIAKVNATSPAINIIESDKEYKVEIAAPGIDKKDFKISVNSDNHLVVSMEKKVETEDKDKNERYLRREFSYSQFQQTLILLDNVNKEKIDAKQENGVLTVIIPKKEIPAEPEAKEIAIK